MHLSLSLLVVSRLMPTICCPGDTQVLCSAFTVLGSLQLGSRVCVSVSTDLWYLRINLIVHMCIQTLKKLKLSRTYLYIIAHFISMEYVE